MKPNYQWLLFDADGTLFDYDRAESFALENTFRDLNLPMQPEDQETYRQINHQVWVDFENRKITAAALRTRRFELLFEAIQLKADAAGFSARYLVNLSQQSHLVEGAEAVIKALARKYQLALITNGLSDVQRPRLAGSPIAPFFQEVAISEEIGAAKPDPAYFQAVFDRIAPVQRDQALVIGDSLSSDIQGGINFGLDTCWYNPEGNPPKPGISPRYQIQHIEELLSFL